MPSAWRDTRLVDVPKTKKEGWCGDQTKRISVGLGTSVSIFFENCEKKNGTVDGGAVQELADEAFHGDRRRQGHMSRDCLQRGSTLVFVVAIATFYSMRCGIPKRERQIMADWYARTWVGVRGCELKAETRRGVVPVNPKADLLSSMR